MCRLLERQAARKAGLVAELDRLFNNKAMLRPFGPHAPPFTSRSRSPQLAAIMLNGSTAARLLADPFGDLSMLVGTKRAGFLASTGSTEGASDEGQQANPSLPQLTMM